MRQPATSRRVLREKLLRETGEERGRFEEKRGGRESRERIVERLGESAN